MGAQMLGRERDQHRLRLEGRLEGGGHADRGCQADARQMQAVLPLGRQCGGLLRAPGPEDDLAAGTLGDDCQRRAPGPRSHDADAPDHGRQ